MSPERLFSLVEYFESCFLISLVLRETLPLAGVGLQSTLLSVVSVPWIPSAELLNEWAISFMPR